MQSGTAAGGHGPPGVRGDGCRARGGRRAMGVGRVSVVVPASCRFRSHRGPAAACPNRRPRPPGCPEFGTSVRTRCGNSALRPMILNSAQPRLLRDRHSKWTAPARPSLVAWVAATPRHWHASGRTCCWQRRKPTAGPGKHDRIGAGSACRPSAAHRFAGSQAGCRWRGAACSPRGRDLDLRQPEGEPRCAAVHPWSNQGSGSLSGYRLLRDPFQAQN